MAKMKFEIATFATGINGSVSETDIQHDAASFSTNISAIAEDGALRGINDDLVLSSGDGFKDLTKQKQTLTLLAGTNVTSANAIASLTASSLDSDISASGTITITDVTEINNGDKVNLIATDSTSHDFTAGDVAGGGTWIAETDNNTTATNLATQINANAKFSASADSAVVTVTQTGVGVNGNTTITLTDSGTAGMSKTDFTGGASQIEITTSGSHGLVSGDIIDFTGTVGSDTDNIDGIYSITYVSTTEFVISADFETVVTDGVVTAGTFVKCYTTTGTDTFQYAGNYISVKSLTGGTASGVTENNFYFWFSHDVSGGTNPSLYNTDLDDFTGVEVAISGTKTAAQVAALLNTQINAQTDLISSVDTATITIECNVAGQCSLAEIDPGVYSADVESYTGDSEATLAINSSIITLATTTIGYGTLFITDDMTVIKESRDVFTMFSIDYDADTIYSWKDFYNTNSSLATFQTDIIHDDTSSFLVRDKNAHIGLGGKKETSTKWIGKIDRNQLNNTHDDWFIDDDELKPLPESMAPLNFDVMTSNQIYDNMIAFNEKQSYHADMPTLAGGTMQEAFEATGAIYAFGDNDADDVNQYGKVYNQIPGIGWCFKVTNATHDSTDDKLLAAKKAYYENDTDGSGNTVLAVGDVFMVVDNVATSIVLEYIGRATADDDSTPTMVPAFFIGATEGSNIIYKVSTSYKTDTQASFATGKRYTQLDLTEILGDSGIMTIAPCRSPLTSGYTTSNSKYICYGDGTVDREHISDQRCRALHMVYWISTLDGNFYRVNLMDFHSLNSDDDYKGPKKDALMILDYGDIGKCQNTGDSGNFHHVYAPIYGTEQFGMNSNTENGDHLDTTGFDSVGWVNNYAGSWSNSPINSNIVGIIETWNNSTEGNSSAVQNNNLARYVYDDDSSVDGDGSDHFPDTGYTDHHHARKNQTRDFYSFDANKTTYIFNSNHGIDVGNIITGFINGAGDEGHTNYQGNTICNRVTGINQFSVLATDPDTGGASDYFPYYSCKVWVLFRRKDDSPYSRWDLMLYNFYPTNVTSDTARLYDRTPPYDEIDKSPHPGNNHTDLPYLAHEGYTDAFAVVQKSTQMLGKDDGYRAQNHSFSSNNVHDSAYAIGIQRRDGSSWAYHIKSDSLRNYDLGRIIGWDGSENLDNVRVMTPVKHTLANIYAQEERPSNYHAMTYDEDILSTAWDRTGNKHQVFFVSRISGELALEGMSAYYRSTEGTKHFGMHTGKFKNYNDTFVAFRVTDNACKPQDTRMWMGHYIHDKGLTGSINQELAYHYSAGGRFKKRVIYDSSNNLNYIKGSGKDGSGNSKNYIVSTTETANRSSSYDGSRMTDSRISYSNSSDAAMLAGQTGDYLMIDRRWLSTEPKVGTTHVRRLRKGVKCIETYHEDNTFYYSFDMQCRMYKSDGNQHTQIRGRNGKFHTNASGNSATNQFPSGDYTYHEMSSRNINMFNSRIKSSHAFGSGDQDGDENEICGFTNTGNDFGTDPASSTYVYDHNRYPFSFEILYSHVSDMLTIPQETGSWEYIRAVQSIYNNNMTNDSEIMISASRISNNETSSTMQTHRAFDASNWTPDWIDVYQSLYTNVAVDKLLSITSTDYDSYPKVITRALVPAEDTAANNDFGHLWANGSTRPATGTSIAQFIAPFSFDDLSSGPNGYDWNGDHFDTILSTTGNGYTTNASLVEVSSFGDNGSEFPANANIKYKMSLLYDGYQESPLSNFFYDIEMASTGKESATIKIKILDVNLLSKRVTHLILYRKNTDNDLYRLVKEIDLDPSKWAVDDESNYVFTFRDDKRFGSYSALNGINENIVKTNLNYSLSASINDSLFVANAWHSEIDDSSKYVFKSKPGNFSQFDYTKDYLVLDSIPVALAAFAGKIYAFDRSNMYKINPDGMFVEDKFEGIGCLNQDTIVVTEFGMCFADRNNIYLHDGSLARPIGNPIINVTTYEGLSIGWQAAAKYSEENPLILRDPFIFYDGESNSFVCFVHGDCDDSCDPYVSRAWVYNISRNRWDYWEAPSVIKASQGKDGDILIANNSYLYNYKKSSVLRDWRWLSKKLSISKNNNDKRFHRVSMLGNPNLATLSSPPRWNDDLVVYVDGEIQELSIITNKYTKSFSGCFLVLTMNDSVESLKVLGKNLGIITGLLPIPNTYIMVEDEIMLVTAQTSSILLAVTRGQLGTTAVEHEYVGGPEGIEGHRVFNIAPTIKLPAKCKGKNIEILLQNQQGVVDSIMIDFIDKGKTV